jgi:amino acid transporter
MAVSEQAVVGAPGRSRLKREVGLIGLMWASVGSIIGSGWLFTAQGALGIAGPSAIIAWGIGGFCVILLALCHAELGGMFPLAGGTARFPHYAFGGFAGASFGWFSWLQAVTVAPIEVLAMIQYSQHYSFAHGWQKLSGGEHVLTGTGILVAIGLMAVFTVINFLGVRKLATTNSAATWWKVAIPLLTIIVLAVTQFHGSNFSAANGFSPFGAKGILLAVSTSGIIFSYLGFEQADQLAGEARNPKRDVPWAVIGSIIIGVIVYCLLQLVFLGALPLSHIGHNWATGAYTKFSGPFAQVATLASLGWLATVLYIDAVISPGGTGLIYTTSASRVSFGLSRNGYFPKIFESTDRRSVPWAGLILAFIIGCICFLPFPSWRSLVGLITSASVLMYAGAPLALGAFRRRIPEARRPYRLPGANIISPAAFVVANYLILWSGWNTDFKLGIAIAIGYAVLVANRLFNLNDRDIVFDLKAGSWIVPYLLGMGLLVWLSDFGINSAGTVVGPNVIPIWWDLVAVGGFSLIIYYWAMAVALPGEGITQTVRAQAIETGELELIEEAQPVVADAEPGPSPA